MNACMHVYSSISETGSTPAQSFYVVKADSYMYKENLRGKDEEEEKKTNDWNTYRGGGCLVMRNSRTHSYLLLFSIGDEIEDEK